MCRHLQTKCKDHYAYIKTIGSSLSAFMVRKEPNQTMLQVSRISSETKAQLDLMFTSVCYVDGASLSLYESSTMKEALYCLNPAYKPPSHKTVTGPLLDIAYSNLKLCVDKAIRAEPWLNVVMDESSNINNVRICNISVHTSLGSFHWLSEDIGARQATSVNIAIWLQNHLQNLSNNDVSRINSIAIDIYATMLKTWEILHGFPDLKHIFCIPCDSHGVQLIVKDILTCIPEFKELLEKAQTIAKAFKNASLQYACLRQLQVEIYGQKRSLCLSAITRWGTQYRLVESLLKSKDALCRYAIAHEASDLAVYSHDYINSSTFWGSLESLRELLQPIDEALRMSESNQAHLEKVLDRWATIHTHLNRMKNDFPVLGDFLKTNGVFSSRYHHQVLPIHIV